MKPFFSFLPIVLLLSSITISSCWPDNDIQTTDLLGQWEIASAFRDGEATETMTGLYFHFEEAGKLLTNMTGMEESYLFELDGNAISQRNGSLDADYSIERLTADSLVMSTTLRSKEFKMVLSKKK